MVQTITTEDGPRLLGQLREQGLLPDRYRCVYAAGSLVRGWGNETSDLDLYVVTDEPFTSDGVVDHHPVALAPDRIPVAVPALDDRRGDVEYWQTDQYEQLMEKISWEAYRSERDVGATVSQFERDCLVKLGHAIALDGAGWLTERQRLLRESAFGRTIAAHSLDLADTFAEDALGQLGSGDAESALLTAKLAFGYAADALLAHHGEFGTTAKWRSRKYRAAAPKVLPFDGYWAIETMRDYDPADPGRWIEDVIGWVRRISMEAEV
ncbi:hypothetical protein [Streptomyces lanatus]|uniref:Polymerase nucleotidyl transferase domain-containing protein n=1 Tax=Streptomyces lanatus TaxID=66900 RepID=A0ABV1XID3_9ACTN|nr:hypothetical protein [Streptomyces lanatus]GHG93643.1 hypothetical protein GCM10018780_16260 [Streptomyces lanatus]